MDPQPNQIRKKNDQENPFDSGAAAYDAWFDSPKGKSLFALEVECVRKLLGPLQGRWLEVGVGTGRFATALGVREGIDPSEPALSFAQRRGLAVSKGVGEKLPYDDGSFDGIVLITALCFVANPTDTLKECHRVLRDNGQLAIAHIPMSSPWGRLYMQLGVEGDPFFSSATFFTTGQVTRLAGDVGFVLTGSYSCLLEPPNEPPISAPVEGSSPEAGFVAVRFAKKNSEGIL